MADAQTLRNALRAQRAALSVRAQQEHAQTLVEHFAGHPLFTSAQHIGFYLAANGEADPALLMQQALTHPVNCYLPRLEGRQMHFHRFNSGDALLSNRFGIDEPNASSPSIAASALDLVLLPLVAFDAAGNRLGMGGGFYDRTFAFRLDDASALRPQLIGLAYGFQEAETLERQPWDVPLDGILTEAGYRAFSR